MPLQQLYNRDLEREGRLMQKDMIDEERIELNKKHYEEGDEIEVYSKLTMHGMTQLFIFLVSLILMDCFQLNRYK